MRSGTSSPTANFITRYLVICYCFLVAQFFQCSALFVLDCSGFSCPSEFNITSQNSVVPFRNNTAVVRVANAQQAVRLNIRIDSVFVATQERNGIASPLWTSVAPLVIVVEGVTSSIRIVWDVAAETLAASNTTTNSTFAANDFCETLAARPVVVVISEVSLGAAVTLENAVFCGAQSSLRVTCAQGVDFFAIPSTLTIRSLQAKYNASVTVDGNSAALILALRGSIQLSGNTSFRITGISGSAAKITAQLSPLALLSNSIVVVDHSSIQTVSLAIQNTSIADSSHVFIMKLSIIATDSNQSCIAVALQSTTAISNNSSFIVSDVDCRITGVLMTGYAAISMHASGDIVVAGDAALGVTASTVSSTGLVTVGIDLELSNAAQLLNRSSIRLTNNTVTLMDTLSKTLLRVNNTRVRGIQFVVSGALDCASSSSLLIDRNNVTVAPLCDLGELDPLQSGELANVFVSLGAQPVAWHSRSILSVSWNTLVASPTPTVMCTNCSLQLFVTGISLTSLHQSISIHDASLLSMSGNDIRLAGPMIPLLMYLYAISVEAVSTLGTSISLVDNSAADISLNAILFVSGTVQGRFYSFPQETGILISTTTSTIASSSCTMNASCSAISISKSSSLFIRRNKIGRDCGAANNVYDRLTSLSIVIKSTSDYVGAFAVLVASKVVISSNILYSANLNTIEVKMEVQNAPNIFSDTGGGAIMLGDDSAFAVQENVMTSNLCVVSPFVWATAVMAVSRRCQNGIFFTLKVNAWKWCSGPGVYVSSLTSPILITSRSVLTFSDNSIVTFWDFAIHLDITVTLDNSTYCSSVYFVTDAPKSIAVSSSSALRLSGNSILSVYSTSLTVGIGVILTSAEVWIRDVTHCAAYLIMTPPLDVFIDNNSVFAIDNNKMTLSAVTESFAILLRTTYASMGTVVWINGGSQFSVSGNLVSNGAFMLYFSCFNPTSRFGRCNGRLSTTGCQYGSSYESPHYPNSSIRPADVYFAVRNNGNFVILSNRIVVMHSSAAINFDPAGTIAISSNGVTDISGNAVVVRTNVGGSIACLWLPGLEAISSSYAKQFHIDGIRCFAQSTASNDTYVMRVTTATARAAVSIWFACLRFNGNNAKLIVNTSRIDSVRYDSINGPGNSFLGPCIRATLSDSPTRTVRVVDTDSVSSSGERTATNSQGRTRTPMIPTAAVTTSASPTASIIQLSSDRTLSPSRRSVSTAPSATSTRATATLGLTASQLISLSDTHPTPTALPSASDRELTHSNSGSISLSHSQLSESHVASISPTLSVYNECPFDTGLITIASTAETIAASSASDGTMAIVLSGSNDIYISYDSLASAKSAEIDFLLVVGVGLWAPSYMMGLNNESNNVLLQLNPTNQSGVIWVRVQPLPTSMATPLYQNITSSNNSLPLSVLSYWPLTSVSSRQSFPASITLSCISSKGERHVAAFPINVVFESSDTYFAALVQTAGRVASTLSLVSVGVGQPSSASRAMTLQQLSSCSDNSIDNSIIPVNVGSPDSGLAARNTLVGNFVVLAIVFSLLSFASGVYFVLRRRRLAAAVDNEEDAYTIRMAMLRLHLPSSGAPAFATTLQSSFAAAAFLVVQGGGALDMLLGGLGFAVWGLYIFALIYLWRVIARTHSPQQIPLPFFPPPDIRRVLGWVMHHNWKWRRISDVQQEETAAANETDNGVPAPQLKEFKFQLSLPKVKARRPTVTEVDTQLMKRKEYQSDMLAQQYHVFLVDFRCLWYAALDAFLTAAGGLISVFPIVFPTSSTCIVANGIVCGTYVFQLLVFIVTNPTTNRFGYVNVVASQLLTLMCAVAQVAGQYALDSELGGTGGSGTPVGTSTAARWKRTASLCKMMLLVISILRYVVDFASIAKGSWRLVREVKPRSGVDDDSGDEYRYAVGDTLREPVESNHSDEMSVVSLLENSLNDEIAESEEPKQAESDDKGEQEEEEVLHDHLWTFLATRNDALSAATDSFDEPCDEEVDGGLRLLPLSSRRRRISILSGPDPL